METVTRVLEPEMLLEEYRRLLQDETIDALPLVVSGSSMTPFLRHHQDTVYLSRLTRPVRKGDILLYRRDNGIYVLHRVWKTDRAGFTMVGDAQAEPEPGIRPDQVIAIVTSAVCGGKRQAPGSLRWEFYEKIWIRAVSLRPFLHRCSMWIRHLCRR